MTVRQSNTIKILKQKVEDLEQSVKNFCQECVGNVQKDITNCTAKKCSLFNIRPYQKEKYE